MADLPAHMGLKQKPTSSRLRHEVLADSAGDEPVPEQGHVQVPDSQTIISESQLKGPVASVGRDSTPVSTDDLALIERLGVAKGKDSVGPLLFPFKLLSKEDFHREPSPEFTYGPARPVAPKAQDIRGKISHKLSIVGTSQPSATGEATKFQRPPGRILQHLDDNGSTGISTGGACKQPDFSPMVQVFEEQADHAPGLSRGACKLASIGQEQIEEAAREIQVFQPPIGELTQATDNHDANLPPPAAREVLRAPAAPIRRMRLPRKNGKKSRPGPIPKKNAMIWPPRSPRVKRTGRAHESLGSGQPILEVFSSTPGVLTPADSSKLALPTAMEQVVLPVAGRNDNSGASESSEPDTTTPLDHSSMPGHPVPEQNKLRSTKGRLHTGSTHGVSPRISKQSMRPRGQVSAQNAGSAQDFRDHDPEVVVMFEKGLGSIRDALSMTQIRNDRSQAAQERHHRIVLSALETTIENQQSHIQSLQRAEVDLRNRLKHQSSAGEKLKKFIKGIETDHEKFKETNRVHMRQCSTKLEDKIGEVQEERAQMETDFQATVDKMQISQRSMRSALDDCYVRLCISESKKRDILENLEMQTTLFEEEKSKRKDLEKQVMASLDTLHRHLQDQHGVLVEKLKDVQATADRDPSDEKWIPYFQECIDAVKKVQEIPFLTAKDVSKTEAMLRYVHESLSSKVAILSSSIKGTTFPIEEFRCFVREQMQAFKDELVNYNALNSEYQKTQQSNERLREQHQYEKKKVEALDAQLKAVRQREGDLKARSAQLELELNVLKDLAHQYEFEPAELGKEVADLRSQLDKAEVDVQELRSRLDITEQFRQDLDNQVAHWKQSADEIKAQLDTFVEQSKAKDKRASKKIKEIRDNVAKEWQKKLQEKEAILGNDLHRTRRERDDKEQLLQAMITELDGTRDALQKTQQQLKNPESEINRLSIEKATADSILKEAQRASQEQVSTSELLHIKDELKSKIEILQSKKKELESINLEYATVQDKAKVLQKTVDQHQTQLTAQQLKLESMRQEFDARLAEQKKQGQSALKDAQSKVLALQKEKDKLKPDLEQSTAIAKSSLMDADARLSTEKGELQTQITKLQSATQTSEQHLQHIQRKSVEEVKRMEMNHNMQIDNFKRQLEQAAQALQECETKCHRIEQKRVHGLEAHERITKQKMNEKLIEEMQSLLEILETRGPRALAEKMRQFTSKDNTNTSQPSQSSACGTSSQASATGHSLINERNPSSAALPGIQRKQKKKVDRYSNSVSIIEVPCSSQQEEMSNNSPHGPHHQFDSAESDYDDDDAVPKKGQEEDEVSLREPSPSAVPETQEIIPFSGFDQKQIAGKANSQTSSSQLSEVDADILNMMELETAGKPESGMYTAGRSPLRENYSNNTADYTQNSKEILNDLDSQARPKSRANTATRMDPPGIQSFRNRVNQDFQTPLKRMPSVQNKPKQSVDEVIGGGSSPDFLHKTPSSTARLTYDHHTTRRSSTQETTQETTLMPAPELWGHKRKGSPAYTSRNQPSKRSRGASQFLPPSLPQPCQSQESMSSQGYVHSQSQIHSPPRFGKSSTQGRTSNGNRTKSGRYDFRFNEFGTA